MLASTHQRLVSHSNAFRVTLCLVFLFTACGRNQTAPVSEGSESIAAGKSAATEAPLNVQTEQKLDPLTGDDVNLYLKVMRVAAGRVKSPTSADRATLSEARMILARHSNSPTPDDANTLQRATLIATAMDQIVADDMKMDTRKYRGIAEAIEAVVPNPATPEQPTVAEAGVPDSTISPIEPRLRTVNAANQAFLTAYREEIQTLLSVVRNPDNLPQ